MTADERHLISIRRSVVPEERGEYDAAWAQLHDAATARGAHAWRFVAANQPDLFLEFLEFPLASGLREDPSVIEAIRVLHQHFGDPYPPPNTLEEWIGLS